MLDAGPRLIAVLCQVRDPGNAGTVLRAADAAGADAVVLTASSVDIYNPKAVRSTAGSLFHLPVVLGADVEELVAACRARGIGILAADGYGQPQPGHAAGRERRPPAGGIRSGVGLCPGTAHRLAVRKRSPGPVRGGTGPGRPPGGRTGLRGRGEPEPRYRGNGLPLRQRAVPAGGSLPDSRNAPAGLDTSRQGPGCNHPGPLLCRFR